MTNLLSQTQAERTMQAIVHRKFQFRSLPDREGPELRLLSRLLLGLRRSGLKF